jgi:hypothetical protein
MIYASGRRGGCPISNSYCRDSTFAVELLSTFNTFCAIEASRKDLAARCDYNHQLSQTFFFGLQELNAEN